MANSSASPTPIGSAPTRRNRRSLPPLFQDPRSPPDAAPAHSPASPAGYLPNRSTAVGSTSPAPPPPVPERTHPAASAFSALHVAAAPSAAAVPDPGKQVCRVRSTT